MLAFRVEPSTEYAVYTDGLTRDFGDFRAVNGLDLRVERGTLYGFLGPNGAGKSTSIKMLTGILAPSAGTVRVLGLDPWDVREAIEVKKRLGVVPEELPLFDNLRAREYLAFVGRMHRLPRELIKRRSEELLALLQLEQVERKLTLEYSHGMKKKLALAGALLPDPDLLFLDEPFEGVDAITSKVVRDMLKRYIQRGGSVVLTSHSLVTVERLCTHVGIIAQGNLVEQTAIADLQVHGSLEQHFLSKVDGQSPAATELEWLGNRQQEGERASRSDKVSG